MYVHLFASSLKMPCTKLNMQQQESNGVLTQILAVILLSFCSFLFYYSECALGKTYTLGCYFCLHIVKRQHEKQNKIMIYGREEKKLKDNNSKYINGIVTFLVSCNFPFWLQSVYKVAFQSHQKLQFSQARWTKKPVKGQYISKYT